MNISIVRIFSAYGVGLSRQVVWEACNQAIHHNKIQLFGTGKESRDFMDASDIAKAIRLIVENTEFHGEIYNVGSGVETSIEELTKIIARIQKVDTINFLGNKRAGDPLNWQANISKLKSFGFEPLISIDEGVKRVLDSLRDVS